MSAIRFELVFVKSLLNSLLFACGCVVILTPFPEMTVFAALSYRCSFVKGLQTVGVWGHLYTLFSVPLVYFSILPPLTHCLVVLKAGSICPLTFSINTMKILSNISSILCLLS
jgi:hypothetical protein